MKELSIEEKAKAYDEALKVLHKYDGANIMFTQDLKEEMFPELKESEDERIRKKLIHIVSGHNTPKWYGLNTSNILAWLEKQGEQKPVEWSEEDINMIDWLIRCCEKEHEELCNDRYGHQEIVSDLKRDCRKKWDWLESLKDKVVPQPKQEWSKEEKKKLDRIYSILGIAADEHAFSTTCRLIGDKEAVELQDFLRSIAKPEQMPEWSEEDESRIDNLCHFLEEYGNQYYGHLTLQGTISWLKSLRPHNTWKPSDAQMVALDGICSYIRNKADWEISQDMVSDLYKLSEQLKKLK